MTADLRSIRLPSFGGHGGAAGPVRARLAEIAIGIVPAAAAGYAIEGHSSLLTPIVVAAAAVWLFVSPPFAAVVLGASIPAVQDISGGRLGVHIALSDVLIVFLATRAVGDGVLLRVRPAFRSLRPLRAPLLQYAWFLLLLAVLHPGIGSLAKTGQRLELFLGPLLVGAYVVLRGDHLRLLKGYLIGCSALAIAWPLGLLQLHSALQKNPTGQFFANAILLLVAVRELRRFLWCLPLLVAGLFLTGSRGALLGLLVGVAVLGLVRVRGHTRVLRRVLPLVLIGATVFVFLPSSLQDRVTNLHPSSSTAAGSSIRIRNGYWGDAERLIARHPWTGIGVGNYLAGDQSLQTVTTDPHDVVLREAAEGGVLFAASFLVLVLGTLAVLWRRRKIELATSAAAVVAATFAHGLVDVYWVRGTPVLGWLLVGMVCALARREPVGAVR